MPTDTHTDPLTVRFLTESAQARPPARTDQDRLDAVTTNLKGGGIYTHVRMLLTEDQLPQTPPDAALTLDAVRICLGHTPPRPFGDGPPRAAGPPDACVTTPSPPAPQPPPAHGT